MSAPIRPVVTGGREISILDFWAMLPEDGKLAAAEVAVAGAVAPIDVARTGAAKSRDRAGAPGGGVGVGMAVAVRPGQKLVVSEPASVPNHPFFTGAST
ncbi:MAG: hypothetical protein RLO06_09685 [Parvibaculum sp.]